MIKFKSNEKKLHRWKIIIITTLRKLLRKKPKTIKINYHDLQTLLDDGLTKNIIILSSSISSLYALWDFIYLSDRYDKKRITARSDRNLYAGIVLAAGVLWETFQILTNTAGLIDKNSKSHKKIIDILSVFHKENKHRTLEAYRNFVVFHLGRVLPVKDYDASRIFLEQVNFIKYDSGVQRDVYYEFANEAINRAFFIRYINEGLSMGEFQKQYEKKLKDFLDYIYDIHIKYITQGDGLIMDIVYDKCEEKNVDPKTLFSISS